MVFATGNQGKVNEFRQMLGDDYEILSMKDIGVDIDIVEDGKTFEENAVIKAKAVMEETGEMVLADDSGFEVDYLNKEPGIYSARYLGEDTPYSLKMRRLSNAVRVCRMKKRDARFVCVIACAYPDGTVDTATELLKENLLKSQKERMDLATTRFLSAGARHDDREWSRKRKMQSATAALQSVKWLRF